MRGGWTGGQYSVYRFVLGAALAAHFARASDAGLERAVGVAAAFLLALGFGDRLAALVLAFLARAELGFVALLLAHLCTPARPYGSLAARGRSDPGGGWRMPRWNPLYLAGPGWIPPRRDGAPATLFYDGDCGLCHRAVRFVLAEDRDGSAFRFAPLASEAFRNAVPEAERAALPDSLVVRTPGGRTLVRTAAVREVCARLGGLWRALAVASRALPTRFWDRCYDEVARLRRRVFARPPEACPLVPAELRRRFD